MLTSCTSSEEENTPYLRKFGHNIRNNDEGRKLSEIPLISMCVVIRTSSPGTGLSNPLILKTFMTVFIHYNEGLEMN